MCFEPLRRDLPEFARAQAELRNRTSTKTREEFLFSTEASLEGLVRLRHRHQWYNFVPDFPATMNSVSKKLIDALATQLERPREVTLQVANYVNGNYEVELDGIGAFLTDRLSG